MRKVLASFAILALLIYPVNGATYTKTVQSELLAITNVAASAQQLSSTLTVTAALVATIFIDYSAEATNTPGTEFRIEVSQKASGNDTWVTYQSFYTSTATVNSHAVDGTEDAGATTIEETTTTGLARNQYIFFKNGTLGNSEWSKLVAFTGSTNFVIQDGLTNAQTGATWYNLADRFVARVDLAGITRLRVVCNNNYGASAVAVNVKVAAITADSIQ